MKSPVFVFSIIPGCILAITTIGQTVSSGLPVDPDSKKITYRDVVNQEGNPGYLYDKAIQWFNYYYLSPASVFSVQDRVNGKVEGLGRVRVYNTDTKTGTHTDGGLVTYQIKIEFKDNKYRYTLTDFNLKLASRFPIERWMNKEDPAYNPNWDSYLYQVDTTMQRLVSTLKDKMKPTVVKKDEW
ncbi:MAG: DUF4468 domain-containing protein [Bacteroidetes bacterium]|nr:DUF4468 domain-containing protein [Bacteroidota bacterium]